MNPKPRHRKLDAVQPHRKFRFSRFERLEARELLVATLDLPVIPSDSGSGGPFVTTGPMISDLENDRLAASSETTNASTANLFPTAIRTVDGNNNFIVPSAGQPFWVRVEFTYDNPVGNAYSIGRNVNDNPTHIAPEITWGSGFGGRTTWNHVWGAWVMHQAGTYSITVTLDQENTVDESNEADNSLTVNFQVGGTITHEWSLVEADEGRQLLGDGTDVIVGTMDDAFDFNHPWFTGNDSKGRPRLVASSQNDWGVGTSPVNASHATAVMGIVLADGDNGGDVTGLAPDARYVTAEFINRAQIAGLGVQDVFDAAGFLVDHGAEVINMSWSWWAGTSNDSYRGETSKTNLLADYLGYGLGIVAVPAVNQLANHTRPTAPGSSRNVITVGGLRADHQRAWSQQDYGPTPDGRSKPDLLGNAAVDVVSTRGAWRDGRLAGAGFGGTSFAAPFVTGAVAQMLDFGKRNQLPTDHRLIKAIVMNSGLKSFDADGSAWSNTSTQPLDNQQGTGILNLPRIHEMYSEGMQPAGAVSSKGFDLREIVGTTESGEGAVTYDLGYTVGVGSIDVTLAWDRHTYWNDANSNQRIDAADSFYVDPNDAQDNLDLVLLKDSIPVASSVSTVDNVEHLHVANLGPGKYQIQVLRRNTPNTGNGEDYAVAWHSEADFAHPPTIDSVTVGDSPGRSQITSVAVTFDQFVEHAGLQNAFLLKNLTDGSDVGQVDIQASDVEGRTVALLTFSGTSTTPRSGVGSLGPSLADGRYELTIDASAVTGSLSLSMSADYNSSAEENVDRFFRLFGDTDGDGDVDGSDYRRFGESFAADQSDDNFDPQLDYDGDGSVGVNDFGHLRRRLLQSI